MHGRGVRQRPGRSRGDSSPQEHGGRSAGGQRSEGGRTRPCLPGLAPVRRDLRSLEPGRQGVRIEDDLLICKDRAINLSESIIKEVREIEDYMAFHKE